MKRIAALAMVIALGGVSACDDGPTDPDDDNTVVFTANMTGAQEVPPAVAPEANGTGTVTITFNVTRDGGGAITAATANVAANVANLPAGTPLILAHIHTGAAGATGGPVVNTGLTAGTAINVGANGTATLTFNSLTVDVTTLNNIIANPAGF